MRFKAVAVVGCGLLLTVFVAAGFGAQDEAQPSAFFPATRYEFASVLDGAKVVHAFTIQNKGNALLKVEKVKTG